MGLEYSTYLRNKADRFTDSLEVADEGKRNQRYLSFGFSNYNGWQLSFPELGGV